MLLCSPLPVSRPGARGSCLIDAQTEQEMPVACQPQMNNGLMIPEADSPEAGNT